MSYAHIKVRAPSTVTNPFAVYLCRQSSLFRSNTYYLAKRSVNAYFEASGSGGVNFLTDGDEGAVVVNVEEKPDIVFLQEMIPDTFSYVESKLPEYMCIAGNNEGYFVATLLRKFTVYYDSHNIIEHPGSLMERNMLTVEAHIGKLQLQLINTHLESTKDHASERIKQLKDCFKLAQDFPEGKTVLLAGDLNLRDKELVSAGGIPPGFEDLWVSCGSRKECQFTWDMIRNMNKEMPGKFKPRFRFDRAYLRNSHPKKVTPVHFGLVGIEKVLNTQCFPSDHWGLHIHFNIENP
ncbi:Tyrosyl-DNA phosphodiesterase 2 [Blattella germanica]|nr:Tyrosyl-DNA phosphodiesterase 2 [Blattella germanica]